ncbi:hypothetical protein Y032_0159g3270 [Ancylostoma ceylanicum]|uniref:Uncharacterized protein n=1 Tax=Ancylostoma ceylanicum TaxID=53326 RepID=A0A016SYF7_9BILA|nr:hypothetical protein Y032_0159g3270 [Ancylostoma ceylanicum]
MSLPSPKTSKFGKISNARISAGAAFNDNHWTRAVSDWTPRNVKHTTGRPPTRCPDFFTKFVKERYGALRVS